MSKKKKAAQQDTTAYTNYLNYLNNYNTSNVDNTLNNMTSYAKRASNNLSDMIGNYNFGVEASDDARQRAEQATYSQYMNYLQPQFERQTEDYATMLEQKGLPVGSEAYQRAMNDLQDRQNMAANQAAYQSVLAGQDAYSQSLNDQIASGNFGNSAQQAYINLLLSALTGSASEYENEQNKYAAGTAKSAVDYQNALAKAQSRSGIGSVLGAIAGATSGGMAGGATGAGVGANIGSRIGSYF